MSKASAKVLTVTPISVMVGNGRNVFVATEGCYHINDMNEAGSVVDTTGFNTQLHEKVAAAIEACAAHDPSWFAQVEHVGSGGGKSPNNYQTLANIFETLKKNTGMSDVLMARCVEDFCRGLQKVIDNEDGARERWMENVRITRYSSDAAVDCGIDTTADVYQVSYSVLKRAAMVGHRFAAAMEGLAQTYNPSEE